MKKYIVKNVHHDCYLAENDGRHTENVNEAKLFDTFPEARDRLQSLSMSVIEADVRVIDPSAKKVDFDFFGGEIPFWGEIEINPVAGGRDSMGDFMEVVPEGKEALWGVYVRLKNGPAAWLADVPTKKHAEQLKALLENVKRTS